MFSEKFSTGVRECLPPDWHDYLVAKRRGGDNGQKGVRFEDFYCAYRLAKQLCNAIDDVAFVETHIELQAEAVLDDLVIGLGNEFEYHQCKNVQRVAWTSGDHPLLHDFQAQYKLAKHFGVTSPSTVLVVPEHTLAKQLTNGMPESISGHSRVDFFPYCSGKTNRLVLECDFLRDHLSKLTRCSDPTDDELVNVYAALITALVKTGGCCTVSELLRAAQGLNPDLVRLLPSQMNGFVLDVALCDALAKIEGLEYCCSRGFLEWRAYGTSGVYQHNCLSREFGHFQARVLAEAPASLEEFEELL